MADAPDTDRQAADTDAREILSVSQLNDRIASAVEEIPALHGVRCIGEVTDLHQNSTALCFTLTDGNAELPCMLRASRYRNMDVDLKNGAEVILEGDIDYWVEGGKIDLKPWEIISSATATGRPQLSDCGANSKSVAGSTTSRNSNRWQIGRASCRERV